VIYDDPEVAAQYDGHFRRRVDRAEDRALDAMIGSLYGRDVLDLGCGTAALLHRHRPRHYLGVDSSAPMLGEAVRAHEPLFYPAVKAGLGLVAEPDRRYALAHGDACEAEWEPLFGPITERSYDFALSLFAFSYFRDPLAALRVARSRLRSGGDLFILAYAPRYRRRRHYIGRTSEMRTFHADELVELAQRAGFTDIGASGFRFMPDSLAFCASVSAGAWLSRKASLWVPTAMGMTIALRAANGPLMGRQRLGQPEVFVAA
jgi:SAM-dependent methyltransferase